MSDENINKICETCHFWAAYGNEANGRSRRGECSMPLEHETRVLIFPLLRRKNSKEAFRWIAEHDELFPDGLDISCSFVTPHDFGCDSWQEIMIEKGCEDE